jgi:2'-5' RNA ligase
MNPYLVKIEATDRTTQSIRSAVINLNLSNFDIRQDFHCTLLFATEWHSEPKLIDHEPIIVRGTEIKLFGKAVVLILDDQQNKLKNRHSEIKTEINARTQFDDFVPHLTLGFAKEGFKLTDDLKMYILNPFVNMDIILEKEKGKVFEQKK